MNDKIKYKQMTGLMNHQTADQKANASVVLFFPIGKSKRAIFYQLRK
ncbi:MAG: hypothetical protein IPG78_03740 [Ignavibacteria bacterium]|nr:hypothetical protein [Ignavibacteria bacterium]